MYRMLQRGDGEYVALEREAGIAIMAPAWVLDASICRMMTLGQPLVSVAGRMARAKQAHDDLIVSVYRAQADALIIEARAKARLADEYDAAQERGEVAGHGRSKVEQDNVTTASDLGLRRDQIHEARHFRDAEENDPGVIDRTMNDLIDRGEEPTKAASRADIKRVLPRQGRTFFPSDYAKATIRAGPWADG